MQLARSAVVQIGHTSCAQNAHSREPCAPPRGISCESSLVMCHRCSSRLTRSGEQIRNIDIDGDAAAVFVKEAYALFFFSVQLLFLCFRLTCLISMLSKLSISIKLLSFRKLRKTTVPLSRDEVSVTFCAAPQVRLST